MTDKERKQLIEDYVNTSGVASIHNGIAATMFEYIKIEGGASVRVTITVECDGAEPAITDEEKAALHLFRRFASGHTEAIAKERTPPCQP